MSNEEIKRKIEQTRTRAAAESQRIKTKRVGQAFTPTVPDMQDAWHFIRWNKVKQKLPTFLAGGLWMARLDAFNDCWEGKLPEPNIGLLKKLLTPKDLEHTLAEYERAAKTGFASCWHLSNGDPDESMWKASKFGNKHNAITIRTSYGVLRSELQYLVAKSGDGPLHVSAVEYIDHEKCVPIPEAQTVEVAFRVRRGFDYQRELRVFLNTTWASGTEVLPGITNIWRLPLVPDWLLRRRSSSAAASTVSDSSIPEAVQRGEAIVPRVDPKSLIREVLVGYKVKEDCKEELQGMLRSVGLDDRIRFEEKPQKD